MPTLFMDKIALEMRPPIRVFPCLAHGTVEDCVQCASLPRREPSPPLTVDEQHNNIDAMLLAKDEKIYQ